MRLYNQYFAIGDQRLPGLEGVRGIAAFMVVIHHYVNYVTT
jgi:peptidoglycan/LPS O-acetylase OafA/YrhL